MPQLVLSNYDLSICEDLESELRFAGIDPEGPIVRVTECNGSVIFFQPEEE
jgi:hypothetical protein